uniref:Uncharacterized protein n=1 Tax=Picea glauca TaxID=3330 RepID=A0A101M153_PICGL|nr:hypothetical protein ABT39_MTgene4351 [Picea glauca]
MELEGMLLMLLVLLFSSLVDIPLSLLADMGVYLLLLVLGKLLDTLLLPQEGIRDARP